MTRYDVWKLTSDGQKEQEIGTLAEDAKEAALVWARKHGHPVYDPKVYVRADGSKTIRCYRVKCQGGKWTATREW